MNAHRRDESLRQRSKLMSYRVLDAFLELRVARRLGRRLTEDEAVELVRKCSGADSLDLRRAVRQHIQSARLVVKREGSRRWLEFACDFRRAS